MTDFFQTSGGQRFINRMLASQTEQAEALKQISSSLMQITKELAETKKELAKYTSGEEKEVPVKDIDFEDCGKIKATKIFPDEIKDISIPTVKEMEKIRDSCNISSTEEFWLASVIPSFQEDKNGPSALFPKAVTVMDNPFEGENSIDINYKGRDYKETHGIRPLITMKNPNELLVGQKYKFNDVYYTAVGPDKLFCDEIIGKTNFSDKPGLYDDSIVAKFLNNYLEESTKEFEEPEMEL